MPPSQEIISSQADTAEVALALCNLGFDCRQPPKDKDDGSTQPPSSLSTMSLNKLADAACRYLSPNADHAASHQCTKLSFPVPPPPKVRPQLLRKVTPDYTRPTKAAATLTPSVPLIRNASHLGMSARRAQKNDVKHRARRSRGKDTSVSFAEMTRLMNTYGPIKCLRNRSNKNPDKEIKAASILRKFYRWFPDFEGG